MIMINSVPYGVASAKIIMKADYCGTKIDRHLVATFADSWKKISLIVLDKANS